VRKRTEQHGGGRKDRVGKKVTNFLLAFCRPELVWHSCALGVGKNIAGT
jgi:hypothetical protein